MYIEINNEKYEVIRMKQIDGLPINYILIKDNIIYEYERDYDLDRDYLIDEELKEIYRIYNNHLYNKGGTQNDNKNPRHIL